MGREFCYTLYTDNQTETIVDNVMPLNNEAYLLQEFSTSIATRGSNKKNRIC